MIGTINPNHHARILANNEQYVHWLAPLDMSELEELIASSPYTRQIGGGDGVLIGFRSDSPQQSIYLTWLRDKFDAFVYIDRVIIGETAQGQGYGRALYEDFEAYAREHGFTRMVCEVNTIPDNPGSHKFHHQMGFTSCGEIDKENSSNRVRFYEKLL